MIGILAGFGFASVLLFVWFWGYAYCYSSIMKKYDEKFGHGEFKKLCNEIDLPS